MEEGRQTVLLADDEPSLRRALGVILGKTGYRVVLATDGAEAVELFVRESPDIVVLDVSMPKMDGFAVCEVIRRMNPNIPLLILSAKGDIVDKRSGFGVGADDYVTKPFNEEELMLRIDALLRRGGEVVLTQPTEVRVGSLLVDFRKCEVHVDGRLANLTLKEFQIVALMAGESGKVFSREELCERVWGEGFAADSVSIPTYIRHIREKIEEDPSNPRLLQTVWSFGYRLGE